MKSLTRLVLCALGCLGLVTIMAVRAGPAAAVAAAVAAAAAAPSAGAVSATVSPATQDVAPGGTFSVDILVDPSGAGVSGGEVNVAFDPSAMSANDIVFGDLFGPNRLVGTKNIYSAAGLTKCALARVGPTTPPTPASKFATIQFTAGSNPGTYPIRITMIGLANESFADIPGIVTADASVTVGGAPPGTPAGTIEVTSSVEGAGFSLAGAVSYSGTAPWTMSGAPAGEYTISWDDVEEHDGPPGDSQTLAEGGSITFHGEYGEASGGGGGFCSAGGPVTPGAHGEVLTAFGALALFLGIGYWLSRRSVRTRAAVAGDGGGR